MWGLLWPSLSVVWGYWVGSMGVPVRAALALWVFTGVTGAHAQIVNVEPLFRQSPDKPYALTAEGSVNGSQGNTDLFVLGLRLPGAPAVVRTKGW